MKKSGLYPAVIFAIVVFSINSAYSQQLAVFTQPDLGVKTTKVETILPRSSQRYLIVKGTRDSTYMKIVGLDANDKPVNVLCAIRKTEEERKYADRRDYKYYYVGKDSYYQWTIVFYENRTENIRIIKQSQGNYIVRDEYTGVYTEVGL